MEIVSIHDHNFRDPVHTLRVIADEIEKGIYGDVGSVAVVLFGDKMEVFGMGRDAEAPSIALLLHAGFLRMSKSIEEHGRIGTFG